VNLHDIKSPISQKSYLKTNSLPGCLNPPKDVGFIVPQKIRDYELLLIVPSTNLLTLIPTNMRSLLTVSYVVIIANELHFFSQGNKYGQPKSLSFVAVVLFGTHKSIFLLDVLRSSSKITKKLDFQTFRTKIHYGFIQNQH
jgi:hypothetical protein